MKPKKSYIISNRLPVTVTRDESGFNLVPSTGGLATALESVYRQQECYWIGWPGIIAENTEEENSIRQLLEPLNCIPVFLNQPEYDAYYNGFSNTILWPLFHYHPGHCLFAPSYWEGYQEVNSRFAEAAAAHIAPRDFVWIHDYQLMLVPYYLQHEYTSYFHHIHFPAPEVFGIIPWRAELLNGLLKCGHLVFQTSKDAGNFKRACEQYVVCNGNVFEKAFPDSKVSHHPISIDAHAFSEMADSPPVQEKGNRLRTNYKGQKIILSVDRLDYSKGILERLSAFRELLSTHKEYHGNIVLVMIIVPSRTDVLSYRQHKQQVDELVGSINAAFADPLWRPVHYYYHSMDRETLCAYYSVADICLVTSLRDGLNLVAKEYIACRNNDDGVLVLSEMAGASEELRYALKIHPYDRNQVASALHYALNMEQDEVRARMCSLRKKVFSYTVYDWLNTLFRELYCIYGNLEYTFEQDFHSGILNQLMLHFKNARERFILLDYDGCLRDFEIHAARAVPTAEILELLQRLQSLPQTHVYLVSGRSMEDMEKWFGNLEIHLIAEHGAWYKSGTGQKEWIPLLDTPQYCMEVLLELLRSYGNRIPGSFIEEKKVGYCLHFRGCRPQDVTPYLDELVNTFIAYVERTGAPFRFTVSPTQFEVLPDNCDKGSGIRKCISFPQNAFIMAAGDDDTDEDMFAVLPKAAFTFKIGRKETRARIRIPEINRFLHFLSQLAGYTAV